MSELGAGLFIEIGLDSKLSGLSDSAGRWRPAIASKQHDGWAMLMGTVANLYSQGVDVNWGHVPIDWNEMEPSQRPEKVLLPTYPFQRERYWVEDPEPDPPVMSQSAVVQSAVIDYLQRGDIEGLTNVLAQSDALTEQQQDWLPQFAALLLDAHQTNHSGWLYQVDWQQVETKSSGAIAPGHWLILADHRGVGATLAQQLQHQGCSVTLAYAGTLPPTSDASGRVLDPNRQSDFADLLAAFTPNQPLAGIIHLWSLDTPNVTESVTDWQALHQANYASVLNLIQTLGQREPQLWIVTAGGVSTDPKDPITIAQAAIWGLGRTLAMEYPHLWGGLVDLAADETERQNWAEQNCAESLLTAIAHGQQQHETQIAIRRGNLYLARLVRAQIPTMASVSIRSDRSYLITGGLGALGLAIARWLIEAGAGHLLLAGRRGAAGKENEIERLRGMGAVVEAAQADVANYADVVQMLAQSKLPPLVGVIHAAGVLEDGTLATQSWPQFHRVMQPKVDGAWNLHLATRKLSLDCFVMFGSDASLLGSAGQGNYAAANAFLDALAHYRQGLGLPALTIDWGPWDRTDGGSGMSTRLDTTHQDRLAAHGFSLIPPERGLNLLGKLLAGQGQIGVLDLDWRRFPDRNQVFLSKLVLPTKTESVPEVPEVPFIEQLRAIAPSERHSLITERLQDEVMKVLGARRRPSPEAGFFDLGVDSLMTIELRNRLQNVLDVSVPTTVVFEYPSVGALADYLLEALFPPTASMVPTTKSPPAMPVENSENLSAQQDVDAIRELSEAELMQLIDAELADLTDNGSKTG